MEKLTTNQGAITKCNMFPKNLALSSQNNSIIDIKISEFSMENKRHEISKKKKKRKKQISCNEAELTERIRYAI